MGCSKRNLKREFHSNIDFLQKVRKISNKQPKLTPKKSRESITKSVKEFIVEVKSCQKKLLVW